MVLKSRGGFTLSLVSGGSFLKKEELKAHISWKRFGKCDKKKKDSSLINLFSKVESPWNAFIDKHMQKYENTLPIT